MMASHHVLSLPPFLVAHLLNLSRIPEPPLNYPNGDAHTHSTLEGGLLNPRLSLQGCMSLDGWNVSGDRGGIDIHMGGVAAGGKPAGRHGRQSSLYRAQSTTPFNAFEGEDDAHGYHLMLSCIRKHDMDIS